MAALVVGKAFDGVETRHANVQTGLGRIAPGIETENGRVFSHLRVEQDDVDVVVEPGGLPGNRSARSGTGTRCFTLSCGHVPLYN